MSGIFFDSANLVEFKKWFDTGILGGVTTNPLILQKDGIFNIPEHIQKMIDICGEDFPISIEVPDSSMTKGEMIKLARKYHNMFPHNAVIKIPMDCRDSQKSFEVMAKLSFEQITVNATLGLTAGQLIGAAEALKPGLESYISLFWGRCEEVQEREDGRNGAEKTLLTVKRYIEDHNLNSKIIIGSIRNVKQIERAFELGADVVTIPPKLLDAWMFTKRGVETADEFNNAYREIKDKVTLI
jgi:transaldolase